MVSPKRVVCLLVAAYVLLCGATIHSRKPWCDEGYNASAAMNLVNHGHLSVSSIELVTAESYPGLDRHWYWQMPLYPVALAGWYVVTGQGLYQQRFFTLFQAIVVLMSMYLLVLRLSGAGWLPVITIAVISLDYCFVQRSTDGRYDMLCASCGFAGLAAYEWLRERSGPTAVLAGVTGVVGAVMTHPIGLVYGAQLAYLILRYDWRRIQWRWVAAAILPVLVAAVSWGLYIRQDPASFRAQFLQSTNDRAIFLKDPWEGFVREVRLRYLFGLGGVGDSPIHNPLRNVRVLVLAVYAAGTGLVLCSKRMRTKLGLSPLVHLWAIASVVLLVLDSGTRPLYLLHVLPWIAALLAASCTYFWTEYPRSRAGILAIMAVFLLVQLAGIAYVIRRDGWRNEYTPLVQYLQEHLKPSEVVLAGPELGFALGFGRQLVDDPCLGYYSKKIPTYIVLDPRYADQIKGYKRSNRPVFDFIQRRLDSEYALVRNADMSRVYRLKNSSLVN